MITNNMQIVKQDEFGADVDDKAIFEASKFDVSQVTLKISKVAEISDIDIQKLFEIFNKFKFVILECEELLNPQENLLALKIFLGSVKRSKRSDENGIIPVENLQNSSLAKIHVSTTNTTHLMHTDGSAEVDPPKIVALQCEVPSQHGGLSQIVCAESIYEYLRKNHFQELQVLFKNPLTITRVDQTAARAIFVEQEGTISITFRTIRTDDISIEIPSQIEKIYKIINNYVNDPKNQMVFKLKAHQILILDNTGVLHGRTAFPENEFRKLNKLWFDGVSEYSHYLQLGFVPKCK
jgi:alpha-ketoglutarate-dependent taurine dioxygenase